MDMKNTTPPTEDHKAIAADMDQAKVKTLTDIFPIGSTVIVGGENGTVAMKVHGIKKRDVVLRRSHGARLVGAK